MNFTGNWDWLNKLVASSFVQYTNVTIVIKVIYDDIFNCVFCMLKLYEINLKQHIDIFFVSLTLLFATLVINTVQLEGKKVHWRMALNEDRQKEGDTRAHVKSSNNLYNYPKSNFMLSYPTVLFTSIIILSQYKHKNKLINNT